MAKANSTVQQSGNAFTPEEMAQIEAGTFDDAVFADRLIEHLKTAPPILEEQQMYAVERNIQSDQIRRVAFAIASMPGSELIQRTEAEREFAVLNAGVLAEMDELIGRYKELVKVFEDVEQRLVVSLAMREDMDEVIKEGKTALFAD